MKLLREKLKNYYYNTIEPSWLLTQEEWSPENSEETVPDPEDKNLIDERINLI
jgi:hypothetical protein